MIFAASPILFFWLSQIPSPPAEKPKFGLVSGVVLNDLNGTPLRRARVSLVPRVAGLADTVVETNDNGEFEMRNIEPGQYGLRAVRDGFLPSVTARRAAFRLPRAMNLAAGDEIKDVTFRMEPWAVIDGKVRFFDNTEPALGVPVFLYRKVIQRARQLYTVAGQTRTDDRGYFRIHGLEPGAYLLAAIYDKPIAKLKEDAPLDAPPREPGYASVFYPSGLRITDALPVRVASGQELTGLDMFLERAEGIRVTGSVTDGCTGQLSAGANIEVARVDEQGATLNANADVQQMTGEYTIRGLTPGAYIVTATLSPNKGNPPCPGRSERQLLTIGSEPVGDFRLMLRPDVLTTVTLQFDGKPTTQRLDIRLEPKTPGRPVVAPTLQQLRNKGSSPPVLAVELTPQETYDVFVDRLPSADSYQEAPYTATAGTPLQVRINTNGGRVLGSVFDEKKGPVPGAAVSLIPESYRPQLFREGYVDRDGLFIVQGLAPGRYLAVPWTDVPPCELNNPSDAAACQAKGKAITVKAGEQVLLELDLKSAN